MTDIAVLKFGGTSVKNIGRIKHVAEIVRAVPGRKKLVVVSAMGDTTDHLVKLSKQCSDAPDKREVDQLLATGEQVSIALLALTLKSLGVNAKSFTGAQIGIGTDDRHSEARILDFKRSRIQEALEQCDVAVIAGFQGLSESGEVTTLGRGGSDTTAVAAAVAAGAERCDIYTDVDGIFTTDPNKVEGAELLETVSFDHVLALAQAGAQVIHPRAVELGRSYGVAIRVRNTFKPWHQGTLITGENEMENVQVPCCVAVESNQALCALSGVPFGARALNEVIKKLASENVTIDAIAQSNSSPTSDRNVLFAIKFSDVDRAHSILNDAGISCCARSTTIDANVAKVSIIGGGHTQQPSFIADVLSVIEAAAIDVKLVTSSENRVSIFVSKPSAESACRLLHQHVRTRDLIAA